MPTIPPARIPSHFCVPRPPFAAAEHVQGGHCSITGCQRVRLRSQLHHGSSRCKQAFQLHLVTAAAVCVSYTIAAVEACCPGPCLHGRIVCFTACREQST